MSRPLSSAAAPVTVIVPVLNGEPTIADCLTSLLRTDYPLEQREILVVDNGSTDRTCEIVARFPVRMVREPRRGLSHARNRGIEESGGRLLAFTDADCMVSTTWLSELVRGLEEEGGAAVVGEVVAYPPATPAERYTAMRKPSFHAWTVRRRRPGILFMNVALRREVFDRVGLFDPGCGSAEDIDFSWRFLDAGLEVRRRPQAVVLHRHRTTARELFRQQVGYGRGQALLVRKYPDVLRWGWREEAAAWVDLGATAVAAAKTLLAAAWTGGRSTADPYPAYDFVRKLGQRVGFVEGALRGRRGGAGAR